MKAVSQFLKYTIPNDAVKFAASSGYGAITNSVLKKFGFTLNFTFRCDDWSVAGAGASWYMSNCQPYTEGLAFSIEAYPGSGIGYMRIYYFDQNHLSSNAIHQFNLINGHTYTVSGVLREGWADAVTGKLNSNIYVDNVGGVSNQNNAASLTFTPSSTFRAGMSSLQVTNTASAIPLAISRLFIANFDMSAAGAPYTVSDYYNGRDISQSLLAQGAVDIYNNATVYQIGEANALDKWFPANTTYASLSYSGNTLVTTQLVNGSNYNTGATFFTSKYIKKGSRYTITVTQGTTTCATSCTCTASLMYSDNTTQGVGETSPGVIGVLPAISYSGIAGKDIKKISIVVLTNTKLAGETFTWGDIKIHANGLVLALQNKLSDNTWTDESANGYNMSLSGAYDIVDAE